MKDYFIKYLLKQSLRVGFNIAERASLPLNLALYNYPNEPHDLGTLDLRIPNESQYVLRMLIKVPFSDYVIPEKYSWIKPLIKAADSAQKRYGINQPFTYLTIRHGITESVGDDEWHVDGFSTQITHLPEQNYIWSTEFPTDFIILPIGFPADFDPLVYNIHQYLQDEIRKCDPEIITAKPRHVYCLDPYVIHRRNPNCYGRRRTFVRVSFTPIEIMDSNNTNNDLLDWRCYKRDGVKNFRNGLKRYGA